MQAVLKLPHLLYVISGHINRYSNIPLLIPEPQFCHLGSFGSLKLKP